MAVALVGLSTDAAFDEDDDDELAPAVSAPAVNAPAENALAAFWAFHIS